MTEISNHPLDLPMYLMTFGLFFGALGIVTKIFEATFVGFTIWGMMGMYGMIKYLIYRLKQKQEKVKDK